MERITCPVAVHIVDFDQARRFLAGVEQVAAEGRQTKDPRVLLLALQVLARQGRTVAELGVRV